MVYRYKEYISLMGCLHTWHFWRHLCILLEQPRHAVWPQGWNRILGVVCWQMVQGSGCSSTESSPRRLSLLSVVSIPASTLALYVHARTRTWNWCRGRPSVSSPRPSSPVDTHSAPTISSGRQRQAARSSDTGRRSKRLEVPKHTAVPQR